MTRLAAPPCDSRRDTMARSRGQAAHRALLAATVLVIAVALGACGTLTASAGVAGRMSSSAMTAGTALKAPSLPQTMLAYSDASAPLPQHYLVGGPGPGGGRGGRGGRGGPPPFPPPPGFGRGGRGGPGAPVITTDRTPPTNPTTDA